MDQRDPGEGGMQPTTGEAGSGRGFGANLRDVFLEPGATFDDVAEHPQWLVPLLVLLAVTTVITFFQMPLWSAMQELALARQDLTPEQREQAMSGMAVFKWIGLAIAPIATAIITAIFAFVFYGWGSVTGARNARFAVAFTALIYAGFILMIQSAAQAVVVAVKGAETVAREGGPPFFGLSLLMERGDMSAILWGFIQNLNVFSIWHTAVLAIAGVHAVRMGKGSAWSFAIAMWVVGSLLMALQGMGSGG